jgi:hypothetical protein
MDVVVADVRDQHAGSGEGRRQLGHQHSPDAELARDVDGVDRPAAALRDHGEVARVAAALDGDAAEGARHDEIGDAHDAFGDLHEVAVEAGGELANGGTGRRVVQSHLAAEEVVRINPAQHDVGIGHRRLGPAATVSDRPGLRARALRRHA